MSKSLITLALSLSLLAAPSLAAAQSIQNLRIMAPASPGGGWDQTSRSIQSVLQDAGIVKPVQVYNVPGAGGTIGLAQLYNSKGDGSLMMTMGLVMVGAIQTNSSKVDLSRVTPLARLTGEYEVVVVPASSPYKNMGDLVAAWKADPGKVAFAGGSAGGTDHMLVGLMAKAAGIDPRKMNYVPFSGGGETLAAVLGNQVAAAVAGYGEFEAQIKAGKLRAVGISSAKPQAGIDPRKMNYVPFSGGGETLAAVLGNQVAAAVAGYGEFEAQIKAGKLRAVGISSAKPQAGIEAPTLKSQGLNVELANWRGIVAPPGISGSQKAALISALDKMHASKEWKDTLETRKWTDLYLSGSKFDNYLKLEASRTAGILKDIGLVK